MPTYGYRCGKCAHEFEIIQRISEAPLSACPKCQGKLTKILYPVGISFKGSGFYTTDYKGSGKSPDSSSNGAASSKDGSSESKGGEGKGSENKGGEGKGGEGKSESKSDTKSETKSETKSQPKSDSKTEKAS